MLGTLAGFFEPSRFECRQHHRRFNEQHAGPKHLVAWMLDQEGVRAVTHGLCVPEQPVEVLPAYGRIGNRFRTELLFRKQHTCVRSPRLSSRALL